VKAIRWHRWVYAALAVGATAAVGCSSILGIEVRDLIQGSDASDGASSGASEGGGEDGTADVTNSDATTHDGGVSDSTTDGGADAAGDASDGAVDGCPAATGLPAEYQACVSVNCCPQWTTCAADTPCVSIGLCVLPCVNADAGTAAQCTARCEVDAGTTAASEFNSFFGCLGVECPAEAGTGDAGTDGGADAAADASDAAVDGCPAASIIPPQYQPCVSLHCCPEWTTCAADFPCVSIGQCVLPCVTNDAGEGGTPAQCTAQCEADAGATASSEFNSYFGCFEVNCPAEAGASDAASE
jgi:hypothetical protein